MYRRVRRAILFMLTETQCSRPVDAALLCYSFLHRPCRVAAASLSTAWGRREALHPAWGPQTVVQKGGPAVRQDVVVQCHEWGAGCRAGAGCPRPEGRSSRGGGSEQGLCQRDKPRNAERR